MKMRSGVLYIKLGNVMSLPKTNDRVGECKSAQRVQELQHDLGLPISSFHNIGKSATSFLWELAQKMPIIKNKKYRVKNIRLTDTNRKGSLTHIMKISEMIMIMLIGLLMIMPIVKILQINLEVYYNSLVIQWKQ